MRNPILRIRNVGRTALLLHSPDRDEAEGRLRLVLHGVHALLCRPRQYWAVEGARDVLLEIRGP